jgi:hypothetical protein
MDWATPFVTQDLIEAEAQVLQLRAEAEALRAEVETLRARIAELEQPRVKRSRGRPTKAEVGIEHGRALAREGKLPIRVDLGTGAVETDPVVRDHEGKVVTSPWVHGPRKRR